MPEERSRSSTRSWLDDIVARLLKEDEIEG